MRIINTIVFTIFLLMSNNGWTVSSIDKDLDAQVVNHVLSNNSNEIVSSHLYHLLDSNSADKYLELKLLFEKSKPASFYDTIGAYTGRCYLKYSFQNDDINYHRYSPKNSGLVVMEMDSEEGPLFPEKQKEVIVMSSSHEADEDYFDNESKEELIKLALRAQKDSHNIISSSRIISLNPLVFQDTMDAYTKSGKINYITNFAVYQNFILIKMYGDEDVTIKWKQGNHQKKLTIKRDEAITYCYYFNKKN